MQSAIGRIQLKKLRSWREKRTNNANIMSEILKDNILVRVPLPDEGLIHAWYKFN